MLRNILSAATKLDSISKTALICLFLGWFFTDTLVATWGSLQHGVKFFAMPAVISDPSMMFFKIRLSPGVLAFSLLCLLSLAAPLLPQLLRKPGLAVANFAPLVLLLTCALLLYQRTSADFVPMPHRAEGIAAKAVDLANKLLNKGSAGVAHHVSVGLGGYLALMSCVVLAVQGVRQLKAGRPDLAGPITAD